MLRAQKINHSLAVFKRLVSVQYQNVRYLKKEHHYNRIPAKIAPPEKNAKVTLPPSLLPSAAPAVLEGFSGRVGLILPVPRPVPSRFGGVVVVGADVSVSAPHSMAEPE